MFRFVRTLRPDLPVVLLCAILVLGGCGPAAENGEDAVAARERVSGDCSMVYGGNLCTWGEVSSGEVVAFGATIPMDIIVNAPDDQEMVWPPAIGASLRLPEAVSGATGFHLLTFFWEAHGHPPGPYLTPHFDFHFYSMTPEAVQAMDCSDLTKPEVLPAGYALPDVTIPEVGELPGLCVPTMGMHSLLASELESEEIFEKTMVLGYYAGRSIFVEPMITRATLMAEQSFTLDWPEATNRPAGSRYPTQFRAEYDSDARAYEFVFSGFAAPAP